MPTEQQVSKLIRVLIRKTIDGSLDWEATSRPNSLKRGTEDVVDEYFEAKYKSELVAVWERKYRTYDGDRDDTYWTSEPRFGIVRDGDLAWDTSEEAPRLWTLFKAARESAIDIENVFETLLSEEE